MIADETRASVSNYYGKELSSSEDLKTNACCTAAALQSTFEMPSRKYIPKSFPSTTVVAFVYLNILLMEPKYWIWVVVPAVMYTSPLNW